MCIRDRYQRRVHGILQNPDGTIQIATQPHVKNRKVIECWSCKKNIVFQSKARVVKCTACNSLNGNPYFEAEAEGGQDIQINCSGCRILLRANDNCVAVQCPTCGSITPVS
eukprot:TRINITY_DN9357_c0_g2_i5.p2 TRINITY_DN9357_c0_g2~~TRINITY_DN9357_c0_g2_i5.p2  ORF type:complete len:111 (+),score=22.36 TRINITY_DN9357_c0_g2_i5:65-397(+)